MAASSVFAASALFERVQYRLLVLIVVRMYETLIVVTI